ncbi:MAG: uracil-DNA glycosylase [Calditrichaeota bacterium]|nr:uracil-DNA glycosylase [Calditrichota bacterium]RQW08532.1 MAG: uracil-DNA glycosylase [Calditrichota bacterium]
MIMRDNQKSQSDEKPDTTLWNFMREIQECAKCPLHKSRTKFVFGDGNEHADLMFIGEAPGADEDRTGKPFVGRAGKLLNKMLSRININREDVFITNILKCRPPNNRDPEPEEVKECFPYLHKQIELIQPKLIVALGRVAAQNLLNNSASLKNMRRQKWEFKGITLIVTYHPAAILRNMGLTDEAQEDFDYINKTYQNLI